MNTLTMPCPVGQVSDGYHTFDELYEHRSLLFLALMKTLPRMAWISNMHADGSSFDGWFIGGMSLPGGSVTYHMPNKLWSLANKTGATYRIKAPEFDGHTSADVLKRLAEYVESTPWVI